MGMRGALVPVVLIPRFTSYFGTTEYATVALDVSAFAGGEATVWRGRLIGTSSPTFTLETQSSHDGYTWFDEDTIVPSEFDSDTVPLVFSRRWFRVVVTLTGTNPGVTCWCTGMLEYRIDA